MLFWQVLGVVICFIGAVSTGLVDTSNSGSKAGVIQGSGVGDVVALLSSVGYGVYTTAMKLKTAPSRDGEISMQLLLGYIGLLNMILLSPVLLALYILRSFKLGPALYTEVYSNMNWVTFFAVCLNSLGDAVLADYFWARAVILTSPTVATIGITQTYLYVLLNLFYKISF